MSHTPGPWQNDNDCLGPDEEGHAVWAPDLAHICIVDNVDDARLIAAAPELLAACEAVIEDIDRFHGSMKRTSAEALRAVVRKARGA